MRLWGAAWLGRTVRDPGQGTDLSARNHCPWVARRLWDQSPPEQIQRVSLGRQSRQAAVSKWAPRAALEGGGPELGSLQGRGGGGRTPPPRSQGAGPALQLLPSTLSHRKLRSQPGCSASARAARAAAGAVSTCVRPASPPGERVPVRARSPEEAGPGPPEWPAARGPGCCAPSPAAGPTARPPRGVTRHRGFPVAPFRVLAWPSARPGAGAPRQHSPGRPVTPSSQRCCGA